MDEYVAVTGSLPPGGVRFGDLMSVILRYHRNMRFYVGVIVQLAAAFGGSKFDLAAFVDGRSAVDEPDTQVGVDALALALNQMTARKVDSVLVGNRMAGR